MLRAVVFRKLSRVKIVQKTIKRENILDVDDVCRTTETIVKIYYHGFMPSQERRCVPSLLHEAEA
jgi:hypothetical protein